MRAVLGEKAEKEKVSELEKVIKLCNYWCPSVPLGFFQCWGRRWIFCSLVFLDLLLVLTFMCCEFGLILFFPPN